MELVHLEQTQLQLSHAEGTSQLLSRNPNTGEVLGTIPIHSEVEVRTAVARARAAQPIWAATPLTQRIKIMRQIQETLVDNVTEITALVSQEIGKSETDTLIGDILLVLGNLASYLKQAPDALRMQRLRQDLLHLTKRTFLLREAHGIVAIISPFNFPVLLSLQSAFAALIAGNAVIHKPSEHGPLTALRIQDIVTEAGLPRALFQVVIGGGDIGHRLVHAGVDYISFIGSSKTGRHIAAAAGEQLVPVTLELGGNNAMLILDDAPLPRAVGAALSYAFAVNGQMCGRVGRIYVHDAVAAEFIHLLTEQSKQLKTTTNVHPGKGDVTALVSEAALGQVERRVEEAVAAGATLLAGGERLQNVTAPVFPPTILADTTHNMSIVKEETFGPVICVMRIADENEAVALANDSRYGLTASVWTEDKDRAWDVARRLQVATVAVNDHLWPFFAPTVPWGGIKASGLGRVGGVAGLQTMTVPKVISFDRLNLPREVYWFPRPRWLHFALLLLIPLLYSRQLNKRLLALFKLATQLRNKPESASV